MTIPPNDMIYIRLMERVARLWKYMLQPPLLRYIVWHLPQRQQCQQQVDPVRGLGPRGVCHCRGGWFFLDDADGFQQHDPTDDRR